MRLQGPWPGHTLPGIGGGRLEDQGGLQWKQLPQQRRGLRLEGTGSVYKMEALTMLAKRTEPPKGCSQEDQTAESRMERLYPRLADGYQKAECRNVSHN
ncbi:hypothetical protein COCOBI_06-5210 [Coccomyxa sp. Obi]|nr:hypothetical protein COCOBI_06-5210 [Coccomyxa sp. Obi]